MKIAQKILIGICLVVFGVMTGMTVKAQTEDPITQDQRQTFQDRLANITDTQKRAALQHVAEKFTSTNTTLTLAEGEVLKKLAIYTETLQAIIARAEQAGVPAINLEASVQGIAETIHETAIEIDTQSTKEYYPNFSTEDEAKNAFLELVSQFEQDHNIIRQTLSQIQTDLQNAILALKQNIQEYNATQ